MDELSELAKPGSYLPKERYHDFRKVFGTPEGQRVMREVLSWCHMFKSSVSNAVPIDPNQVILREGERNIGLKMLSTYHNEPPERPEKTRRK